MSQKKAKQHRKDEALVEISIKVLASGDVKVSGPVGDLFLLRDIITKAERTVFERIVRNAEKKSNIIVPDLKILTN